MTAPATAGRVPPRAPGAAMTFSPTTSSGETNVRQAAAGSAASVKAITARATISRTTASSV
ncbi:MAG: hypothetical protein BWX84_02194 [Verrucomicrobia bacterium ADurb.Bin118]|nr:MAG: hypothetical protein BWX84_02194 [Verrucomicrobia bacterium ADurb.Bin118]